MCVEPFIAKEVMGMPAPYGSGCFQVIHGTEGHGLVQNLTVLGLQLDSVILKIFFNVKDSMICFRLLYRRNRV